jgi:tetratricopeptide (TPR) repeat protein
MIADGQGMEAMRLLEELRGPMIEAGEQDKFLKAVSSIVEKLPKEAAPLELMVDFCRYTSNSHQLPLALSQLADLCAATGNYSRAEECLQELIDRNKDDERLVERLSQLRAQSGGTSQPAVEVKAAAEPRPRIDEDEKPVPPRPPAIIEETHDEETQKYIAQALTDVDLFSSYGLTQKATHLLENVLQRAPRHTPTLERLLDMHLGAGDERRTAELASQLEQIHRERNDTVNADRFLELRERFQKAAGMSAEELPSAPPLGVPIAPPSAPEARASFESAAIASEPPVFEVPPSPTEAEAAAASASVFEEFEISLIQPESQPDTAPPAVSAIPAGPAVPEPRHAAEAAPDGAQPPSSAATPSEEVDLSDEWEAMIQDVADTATKTHAPVSTQAQAATEPPAQFTIPEEAAPALEPEPAPIPEAAEIPELTLAQANLDEPAPSPAPPEPEVIELQDIIAPDIVVEDGAPEPAFELVEELVAEAEAEPVDLSQEVLPVELSAEPEVIEPSAEPIPASAHEFDLELAPQAKSTGAPEPATTEDFISDLVAEIDGLDAPDAGAQVPAAPASLSKIFEQEPEPMRAAALPHIPEPTNGNALEPTAPQVSAESLNQLAEVFQEFRAELGELGEEDEDLETHYNLGIAYREMGLLDEAIGEFQKVAKAVQKGKPFRYAMNCATMLGLTFMDKGEPKVASMWYQRALESPGLEQEAVLALRYDLGMALENAGESKQALDSFRQVYAMNIDYRDVADRIAELQRH